MIRYLFLFLLFGVVACSEIEFVVDEGETAVLPTATAATTVDTASTSPTATTASSTNNASAPTLANPVRELTILYTNDEHGWMEGMQPGEGAANLMGLWREVEGLQLYSPHLILSGGDMWTGPAISTWFDGESMTEVMNAMGYTAAAVGNHEFDFGLTALQMRSEQANFPFLSANMRWRDSGEIPTDLNIEPYTVVEANGIQVGIIGLTTTSTPRTTNPVNVVDFEFIGYEAALREVVPLAKADGAELLVVITHVCGEILDVLARQVDDLGIHLLTGGHCNELFAKEVNDIVVISGGFHMTAYARVAFTFDTAVDEVVVADYATRLNRNGVADPAVEEIVNKWRAEAEVELNQVVGYTERGIFRRSQRMQDLITQAWLLDYPTADVAITNWGGMRDAIPAGDITLGDVVSVMPFNNVLVDVTLTGDELMRVLARADGEDAIGGVYRDGREWFLIPTGERIEFDETYHLLVNDFMYAGGSGYGLLAQFDPNGYNTAIDWRQPIINWLLAQESSPTQPVDSLIDTMLEN